MATQTQTVSTQTSTAASKTDVTKELLDDVQRLHTLPLWTEMSRLNPPEPNPTCIPHLWPYDEIRPHLLKAGEMITEKQAERRVLMLVNPARCN